LSLPAGSLLANLSVEGINGDRHKEILVVATGPEPGLHWLGVVAWWFGHGALLCVARSEGEAGWLASYGYPPLLQDLDGDGSKEIVIMTDTGHMRFLAPVVYEWDGRTYTASDLYVIPPRLRPTLTCE